MKLALECAKGIVEMFRIGSAEYQELSFMLMEAGGQAHAFVQPGELRDQAASLEEKGYSVGVFARVWVTARTFMLRYIESLRTVNRRAMEELQVIQMEDLANYVVRATQCALDCMRSTYAGSDLRAGSTAHGEMVRCFVTGIDYTKEPGLYSVKSKVIEYARGSGAPDIMSAIKVVRDYIAAEQFYNPDFGSRTAYAEGAMCAADDEGTCDKGGEAAKANGKCFRCGKAGHYARYCPLKKKKDEGETENKPQTQKIRVKKIEAGSDTEAIEQIQEVTQKVYETS